MGTQSEPIDIAVHGERIAGTFLRPAAKVPGVLFVHGWGGSQHSDLVRARDVAGLGCVCLTFDLRGHEKTREERMAVSREDNLLDVVAAYDRLLSHPALDSSAIAVVGSSYGGYLASILTTLRPVRWLALHVPALYRDEQWDVPKARLDRTDIDRYRRSVVTAESNRALAACADFRGDVLIVEAESDRYIPHQTIMNYRSAFVQTHSLTHRILDGSDHALTGERSQAAYHQILLGWASEMIIGERIGGPAYRFTSARDAAEKQRAMPVSDAIVDPLPENAARRA